MRPQLSATATRLLRLADELHTSDGQLDIALATNVIAHPDNPTDLALAHFVVGTSVRESGRFEEAADIFQTAVSIEGTAPLVLAQVGSRMASLLAYLGRFDDATAAIERAKAQNIPESKTRIILDHALVMSLQDRFDLAIPLWLEGIARSQACGDVATEMTARAAYGSDLFDMNRVDDAELELRMVLLEPASRQRTRIQAIHLLSRLLTHRGDLAEAFYRVDQSQEYNTNRPWIASLVAAARTEAFLSARILGEAEAAASEALQLALARPESPAVADALVLRARAAIANRSVEQAVADITEALARYKAIDGSRRAEQAERILRALDLTQTPEFPRSALLNDVSLIEALYLSANRCTDEQAELKYLDAIAVGLQSHSVTIRTLAGSAAAQRALLKRIPEADELIETVLMNGELVVNDISSLEVRSNVFYDLTGSEFISLALGQAGSQADVFCFTNVIAERVHRRLAIDDTREDFLNQLVALRQATRCKADQGSADRTSVAGHGLTVERPADLDPGGLSTDPWGDEHSALERRIRSMSRLLRPREIEPVQSTWTGGPSPTQRTVTFIVAAGEVWRSVIGADWSSLDHVGSTHEIDQLIRRFRFAFDLVVNRDQPALDADSLQMVSDELYALLLGGVRAEGQPLVLRLTRHFTNVPWRLLNPAAATLDWANPGVVHRTAEVSLPPLRRVTIIAGPGLGQPAVDEVAALTRIYPDATVLVGCDATVDQTLDAFEASDLVHIIGHGVPHATDPMMASIALYDGRLMAYDIEGIHSAPAVVVLAACGVAAAGPAGQPSAYGIPSVLLQAGSLAVIASPMWIDNQITARIMPDLHRALAAGATPVEALAQLTCGDALHQLTSQAMISMQAGPISS